MLLIEIFFRFRSSATHIKRSGVECASQYSKTIPGNIAFSLNKATLGTEFISFSTFVTNPS